MSAARGPAPVTRVAALVDSVTPSTRVSSGVHWTPTRDAVIHERKRSALARRRKPRTAIRTEGQMQRMDRTVRAAIELIAARTGSYQAAVDAGYDRDDVAAVESWAR